VIDDEPVNAELLETILADSEYQNVKAITDSRSALELCRTFEPDLVLLDLMMPFVDGLTVCRRLRARGVKVPILMLTARHEVADRVSGLDAGADDYLSKPFDVDELLARVKALLRRSAMRADDAMLRVGDLTLDTMSRAVTRAGRPLSLTQKEYALLEYLMRHAGLPVTREQIAEHVWKTEFDPSTNIVDVYINYLRKKLDVDGPPLVHTVRGTGYVLEARGEGRAAGDDSRGASDEGRA